MPSFIFTSPIGGSGKSDLFAISLVMPIDKLSLYLPISHLVIGRMRSLIKKKQAILKKEGELSPSVFAQFTDLLNPFLSAISTMGIYLEPSSQLVDTVFYPGNETMFELTFLRKAISSHLQTGGVTIVVGHDAGRINMMIQTLVSERIACTHAHALRYSIPHLAPRWVCDMLGGHMCTYVSLPFPTMLTCSSSCQHAHAHAHTRLLQAIFLTRDERRKSRFAFDAGTAQYAPDLCLQGIILAEGEFDIDASLVLQSESPSSVISLKDLTVRQTKERNEYKIIHGESFVDELRRLEGADPVDARPPMPKKHLFHYIQDKSLLVRDVVDRVFKPYPRHIRQAMLSHFYRGLYRKANVMIQYIDAVGAKPASPMSDEDIRVMRRDLELTCRQDFEILLAFADKLRPGMFDTLLGDPIIKEELMIGLLGAF